MKNIVLTGFMASGKTTIGKELAKITERRFVDTDLMIEQEMRMTINEIFANFGEEYFRDLETIACHAAAGEKGVIISTGGGAVMRDENRKVLKSTGVIFNLEMNEELIKSRLQANKDTRPLMSEELNEVIERFNSRKIFYEDCDCKVAVYDGRTPTDYAAEILKNYTLLTIVKG